MHKLCCCFWRSGN